MKVRCAWCKKDLGEKPGPSDMFTDGMCMDCARKELEEAGLGMDRIVEVLRSIQQGVTA